MIISLLYSYVCRFCTMANHYDGKFVEENSYDVSPSRQRHHNSGGDDGNIIDPDSGVKRGLKNRHLSR